MNRIEKLLNGLDLSTVKALEIGALDKPIVPPSTPGVFYVDFLDTPGLRERYKNDVGVNVENIVHVGGVWGQQTLAEVAAPVAPLDVVVASHVVEHVPDLIAWLREIASVLTADGEVRLAVPDRRYSFDYARAETDLCDVLLAHYAQARVPQPAQVLDFAMHMADVDCAQAWAGPLDKASLKRGYTDENAIGLAAEAAKGIYHDVHCWVFTPASFARLMYQLAKTQRLDFKCAQFFETELNTLEFMVSLKKSDSHAEILESWASMQRRAEDHSPDHAERRDMDDAIRRHEQQHVEDKAQLEVLQQELSRVRAQLEQAGQEIAAIRRSRSWLVTAPLRALRRRL